MLAQFPPPNLAFLLMEFHPNISQISNQMLACWHFCKDFSNSSCCTVPAPNCSIFLLSYINISGRVDVSDCSRVKFTAPMRGLKRLQPLLQTRVNGFLNGFPKGEKRVSNRLASAKWDAHRSPSENVLALCDEATCFWTSERVEGAESSRNGDNYVKKRGC